MVDRPSPHSIGECDEPVDNPKHNAPIVLPKVESQIFKHQKPNFDPTKSLLASMHRLPCVTGVVCLTSR